MTARYCLAGLSFVVAHPAVAAAPARLGGGGELDFSLGRIVLSLIVCIIIAVLAILLIRQRSGRIDLRALFARIEPRAAQIRIVETRRLSPHADISVVEHGGREYLLLLQPTAAQVLRARDIPGQDIPCA